MGVFDEGPVAGDQILGRDAILLGRSGNGRKTDVVDAFEKDDPANSGSAEDVPIESRQRVRAGPVMKDSIAVPATMLDPRS